jgi:hypothetical protein
MNQYEDFLRADINRTVRRFCFQNGLSQADVWRGLRMRLMVKTGFTVPTTAKNKLAEIQKAGHLETFHNLAEELTWLGR